MITTFSLLADAAAGQPAGLFSSPIVPMTCLIVLFYFVMIRPQSKQRKELQSLIANLKTGDKVVTSGGIHGIIANVKEGTTLLLKVADNVKIEIDKSAIATVDKGSADKGSADKSATDKNPALIKS